MPTPTIDDEILDAVITYGKRLPIAENMRVVVNHVEAATGYPPISVAAVALLFVSWARIAHAQATGWSAADINNGVGVGVTAISSLALGYVAVSQILEKRRREHRKAELEDELAAIRARDEVNRTTLTGQLEEIKKKAEWAAKDSETNQKAMRDSLRAIRDDLNTRTLENQVLRQDFMAVSQQLRESANQLQDANKLIDSLRTELQGANERLTTLTRGVDRLNRGMDDALAHPS